MDENIYKNSSPMRDYYEGLEKNLIKTKSIVDLNNSINFVKKNIISSSKFNFNNNKFKKNYEKYENYNKLNFYNYSNNYNNYNLNIEINNNYNNAFYSNNLNINFF